MVISGHRVLRRLWRIFAGRPRLFIGLICGFAVLPLLSRDLSQMTRAIIAWDTGVGTYLVLSILSFTRERISRMAKDAAAQEEGEWTIFSLTVAAISFSFAAIISEFAHISNLPAGQKSAHITLVGITLILSWLMAHMTFAFRYAHEYYQKSSNSSDIDRGLAFPDEDQPDYFDFLYFSIVIGMTFQVSDVQITARKFRRMATVHGVLSFLFNTIILALTVNLAAGLL